MERCLESVVQIEELFLQRRLAEVKVLSATVDSTSATRPLLEMALGILTGRHIDMLLAVAHGIPSFEELVDVLVSAERPASAIQALLINCIADVASEEERLARALMMSLLGTAFLELYWQANYTGPELSHDEESRLGFSEVTRRAAVRQLECDGIYAYGSSLCRYPEALFLARSILAVIAEPRRMSWKHGFSLDSSGHTSSLLIDASEATALVEAAVRPLQYKHLCSARAVVTHARLLLDSRYSEIPTLWMECRELFVCAAEGITAPETLDTDSCKILLQTSILIEWGLSQHIFEYGDKGKALFQRARQQCQLTTELTAAMGKRTKYQQTDHAQLYLFAKSALQSSFLEGRGEASIQKDTVITGSDLAPTLFPTDAAENEAESDEWQHGKYEVGRRLVVEALGGEEAAVRQVLLDDTDGGPKENILLEGGPKFSFDDVDRGGDLHEVEQAVILALCLDVENNNPKDGLTTEEMFPYLERILLVPKNWMIHSTALLERSWLEYEKRRTADRAMLQIQALLDQHYTKLTVMQASFTAIEQSAPVQDRIAFLPCLVYPAQYELKRDLAFRYLRCQVFSSALALFLELELWDEVVKCYQLLQKPHRAELVIRDRLKVEETPYMLTSLADLKNDPALYERAWEISRYRYARAKRSLSRYYFDRQDFRSCIDHMDQALAIQPLVATAWYLRGIACMHVEDWQKAVESFTRCVQQDMEIGEAWANIGAVHMKQKDFSKAQVALEEALKHKPGDWRILENLMIVSLGKENLQQTIRYMNSLIDLKVKSGRPVHKQELRRLVQLVLLEAHAHDGSEDPASLEEGWTSKVTTTLTALDDLLTKISLAIKSDPDIWEIYAYFVLSLGRMKEYFDIRLKQFRALLDAPAWEKSEDGIKSISSCAKKIADFIRSDKNMTIEQFYSFISILKSAITKAEINFSSNPDVISMKEDIDIATVEVEKLLLAKKISA